MKVAVIQMNTNDHKQSNIDRALILLKKGIQKKAKFLLLPEVFHYRGDLSTAANRKNIAEDIPGESTTPFIALAKKAKVSILIGSLIEKAKRSSKVYNTSVLINSRGEIQAKYRKINLFHATLGKKTACEPASFLSGNKSVLTKVNSFQVGLSICYDLRFPLLYRRYAKNGADILTVPASFTHRTGQDHWEALLRARAIENHCYVLAPNQIGKDGRGILCYGHSMIINPWGDVLAEASADKEEVIVANIDHKEIQQARKFFNKK